MDEQEAKEYLPLKSMIPLMWDVYIGKSMEIESRLIIFRGWCEWVGGGEDGQ